MNSITPDKTVFFDFDSTMADTEPYHIYARDSVLASFGVHISDWGPYLGNSDLSIFSTLKERYHLDMDVLEAIDTKLRIFKEQAIQAGLQPYPDIADLVRTLPNRKFVITNQRYEIVSFFLKKWALDSYFEDIISLVQEANEKCIRGVLVVDGKVSL